MRRTPPILLLLLGLLAGFPAARLTTTTPEKKEAPKAGSDAAKTQAVVDTQDCQPQEKGSRPPPWCEPVRVLREFFALPLDLEKDRGENFKQVTESAKRSGYELHFHVALVPAPLDPLFDQALEAIQMGFASQNYLIDRFWLPWTGDDAAQQRLSQQAPGILLFRQGKPEGRSLAVVFLIGETSKAGIQKEAFQSALELIAGLQKAAPDAKVGEPKVSILGPSFSGSVESLRVALLRWKSDEDPSRRIAFRVTTGSATASGLEKAFEGLEGPVVSFCRTIVPDDELRDRALGFLHDEMGWDLGRVALLTEADTQYGQSLLPDEEHSRLVWIPFPSHISDLRNDLEAAEAAQKSADLANPLKDTRRRLDLNLSGREQVSDLVPTFSSLTTRSNDLVLSNLLETIAREGIRYVGIVATDVKDKIFLAEAVRDFSPDVVLFTFDNNLLYAHPQYSETMDGMLVFSSSPLFIEARRDVRRQFSSELQQGLYRAVRYVLTERDWPRRAWIAAVGNGSLWPIANLKTQDVTRCPTVTANEGVAGKGSPSKRKQAAPRRVFDDKDDLQILLVAAILCLLAVALNRTALLDRVVGSPQEKDADSRLDFVGGTRCLLFLGSLLLAAGAGVLLAVSSLPGWARVFSSTAVQQVAWGAPQWAYVLALALIYGLLVLNAARAVHGGRIGVWVRTAWALGGSLAFLLLVLGLNWLCIPGGQIQFFYLRARAFSSGLSPLVSLCAVGAAVYVWLLSELKRRRLMVRQATDCPIEAFCDPALSGCTGLLRAVRALLTRTLPQGIGPWALPLIAFVPPLILLWRTVQPIGETRPYGRFFILFLAIAFSLSALSFYRFVRLWYGTLHLLHRLDNASPAVAKAFEDISDELDWRPIKTFGWQIPPFKTLVLSVRKLDELVEAGKINIAGYPESVKDPLKTVFENERDGGTAKEIEGRNALEAIFAQACVDLQNKSDQPDVLQFLALRVAAYLRYIFAHLRSFLIGGLTCGLLALFGVTAYVFEPKHFVSLAGWLALTIGLALVVRIFLQMDRNPTLSRIGHTKPGQVTFDRAFLTKLLTYIGIPLIGLVATQFPEVGHLVGRVADQFLRIGGGG